MKKVLTIHAIMWILIQTFLLYMSIAIPDKTGIGLYWIFSGIITLFILLVSRLEFILFKKYDDTKYKIEKLVGEIITFKNIDDMGYLVHTKNKELYFIELELNNALLLGKKHNQ